jgi:hypothetical protein
MRSMVLALVALLAGTGSAYTQETPHPLCRAAILEEQVELEEARLQTDLSRSELDSYIEIFKLIEDLWKNDAIERMLYLQAKYDRDAARLTVDKAVLLLQRQEALIEQYRLACRDASGESDAIDRAHLRYRTAHCATLVKDVEIATVNLEFDRVLLASVRELRAGKVATRPHVIRAELDVELEEKRLATAKKRVGACNDELPALTNAND